MVDSIKIQSFEQLQAWQEAQVLAVLVYSATKNFPKDEVFGLTSQIKRASSSVSANIAEDFGRRTTPDKLHFYSIAYGSLLETKNFLYLANKLGFIDDDTLEKILSQVVSSQKLLNALMRSLRS